MRFLRMDGVPTLSSYDPELLVAGYVATRASDPARGPQVRLHPADARRRLLTDGELVWVYGPRGQQVATLVVDDAVAEHTCVLRDVAGVTLSERVRVSKPNLDAPKRAAGTVA